MAAAYYAQRPPLRRRNSPNSLFDQDHGFATNAPMMQRIDVGDDSSEDDIPQPMKFSALTRALLENNAPANAPSPHQELPTSSRANRSQERGQDTDTPSRAPLLKIVRKVSPNVTSSISARQDNGTASPRILSISRDPHDSARRAARLASSASRRAASRDMTPSSQYVTPGSGSRTSHSARSRADSFQSDDDQYRPTSRPQTQASMRSAPEDEEMEDVVSAAGSAEAPGRYGHGLVSRTRNVGADMTGPPPGATMRIRRAAVGAQSVLRGAPMRRNLKRRDSDELPSPTEPSDLMAELAVSDERHEDDRRNDEAASPNEPSARQARDNAPSRTYQPLSPINSEGSPSTKQESDHAAHRVDSAQSHNHPPMNRLVHKDSMEGLRANRDAQQIQQRRPSVSQGAYRPPPPSRHNDPASDQENMPPPTFKRNKDSEFKVLGHVKPGVVSAKVATLDTTVAASRNQSPRRALGALAVNTPQRPAPPPPKMSMLDTVTKTAGASVTKSKKRRAHVVLNGKTYLQLAKVGRGGTSDVYSVMAENQKLFALKRVKLEDCDELALRGFKGEIDLLRKLEDVERVIHLYDWELDEPRGLLSLLMEKGEGDFNTVLQKNLGATDARLDTVFIRWWWREMLECVSAVHAHDIVHSDLKPGNFLVVNGRLKLIDFGIANAIDTDNTVNVHRENHVGTPNYMSPESIQDSNAPRPGASKPSSLGQLMKLGKPSDVWSLGCILYQMVYARPPFAHIASQIGRIYAITDPHVAIAFPAKGLGDAPVPPALLNAMRRCLQRNPALRPTVDQLLAEDDPWIYPEAGGVVMSEDLLSRIIKSVAEKCARGEGPNGEHDVWARTYLARVAGMVEMAGVEEAQIASA